MVDAAAEIAKLEKQLGSVDQRGQGLERQMNIPGYETKVRFFPSSSSALFPHTLTLPSLPPSLPPLLPSRCLPISGRATPTKPRLWARRRRTF